MPAKQLTIVVYGKGGVGKTTVCSHLAVCFAREGRRVLLLGCDPKADTALRLLGGAHPQTIVDVVAGLRGQRFRDLVVRSRVGVDVIETGGPEPGRGCGGRGVATLCQFLEEHARELSGYDAIIYDVLGDLVCGGFVAPLRSGLGRDVYIVSSEEPASLFAANNIVRVAAQPYHQEVSLGGIIFNLRQNDARLGMLDRFAARLGVRIAAVLPRDPAILDAEEQGVTVVEQAPESPSAARFFALAKALSGRRGAVAGSQVRPMSSDEFWSFVRENRAQRPGPDGKQGRDRSPAVRGSVVPSAARGKTGGLAA